MASESEWSQHKKLIDFSTRPGGFRRALVPNIPYFMVQWDYKGEKGYGHVIEGVEDAAGGGQGEEGMGGPIDEGDRGGGRFPAYVPVPLLSGQVGVTLMVFAGISQRRSLGICWSWNLANGGNRNDWTTHLINKGPQSWATGSNLLIGRFSYQSDTCTSTNSLE